MAVNDTCFWHEDHPAAGYCAFCGRPVCDECHEGAFCNQCIEEPPKRKSKALLFAVLFGWLGVHRYYMGFYFTGVIYTLSLGLFGIGWAIDVIRILFWSTISDKESPYFVEAPLYFTVGIKKPTGSLLGDLAGALGDAARDGMSSDVRWFFDRRFWRDKSGRPLLRFSLKSLTEEKETAGKEEKTHEEKETTETAPEKKKRVIIVAISAAAIVVALITFIVFRTKGTPTAMAPDSQNSSTSQTNQSTSKTFYATTNLRVRSEPDTSKDNQVGRVPEGDSVELLEVGKTASVDGITAPWYRVRIADGTIGWVFSGYLSDTRDPLIGTWEGSEKGVVGEPYIATYKFSNGNVEVYRNGSLSYSALYTTHGNVLFLEIPDSEGVAYDYSVSENTLTLRYMDPYDEGSLSSPSIYTRK